MDLISVRRTLDELIRNSGDDYASLSRLLGRNPTYIQQFISAGYHGVCRRRTGGGWRCISASGNGCLAAQPNGSGQRPRGRAPVPHRHRSLIS